MIYRIPATETFTQGCSVLVKANDKHEAFEEACDCNWLSTTADNRESDVEVLDEWEQVENDIEVLLSLNDIQNLCIELEGQEVFHFASGDIGFRNFLDHSFTNDTEFKFEEVIKGAPYYTQTKDNTGNPV